MSFLSGFKNKPTHLAATSVQFAASGATVAIVGTGKTVALWGASACAAQTTSVTISVQTAGGVALWVGRTGAVVGNNIVANFSNPILSTDGLRVVSTGAANGCDIVVLYEVISQP